MKALEIGQKMRIKFKISSIKEESLLCVVKWFENDRAALVFPDNHKHLLKSLPEGKELEAVLYSDAGIFVFDSIVINSPLEHDFVIEIPDEKKHVQRRDYIRVPLNLKFVLQKPDMEVETKTVNIGGGGIRFVTKQELKDGDIWSFILYLPGGTKVKGKSSVLYSLLQGNYITSIVKFIDISETDRNKIIKLCFEEEVRSMKKKR